MVEARIKAKLDIYLENMNVLKSNMRWKAGTHVLALLAAQYVMNNKRLEVSQLIQVSQTIVGKVGWFSPFRSYQKFNVAAYLITKFDNPDEHIDSIIGLFNELKQQGLPNNSYTVISALSLMKEDDVNEELTSTIKQIKAIYKGMRSKHFFLTTHSDYPLATLLAKVKQPVEQLIETVESYYQTLAEHGFRKGNDLQFLSHIMMIIEDGNQNVWVEKVKRLFQRLTEQGFKIKPRHYPILGLLVSVEPTDADLNQLKLVLEEMNQARYIKHTKDINLIVSTMLIISEKINNDELLETNLSTTIEAIIQAQQAAMIAAIAASSAAAAGAASN